MPRFAFKAMTIEGRVFDGEAVAETPLTLAADLAGQGLMLVSHHSKETRKTAVFSSARADARKVTAFLSELATMLRGGLPLDEALDLSARDSHGALAKAIATMRADVRSGSGVADAFERQTSVFGPEIGPLARVAETTGDLEGMLGALAAERDRSDRLRRKVTDALGYPIFLIVSATAVLAFFLLNVIPQFSSLLHDAPTDPGMLVRVVLGASDMLISHQTEAGAGLALALLAALMGSRSPATRRLLGSLFSRLPGVRGTLALWRASTLLSHLGLLCAQGVSLNRIMQLLEGLVGEDAREPLRRASDRVRRGERLHVALASENLAPALALRMISIGESTGDLAKVANEAGAYYAKKLEERLNAFAAIIGPAAILVIASLIGGLMVTIMSALTSVNQSIL
jgi:general secretion pathway protein F